MNQKLCVLISTCLVQIFRWGGCFRSSQWHSRELMQPISWANTANQMFKFDLSETKRSIRSPAEASLTAGSTALSSGRADGGQWKQRLIMILPSQSEMCFCTIIREAPPHKSVHSHSPLCRKSKASLFVLLKIDQWMKADIYWLKMMVNGGPWWHKTPWWHQSHTL